jgi:ribosome maturation factor RimP
MMRAEESVEVKILELLSPSVESMGYEIVRVRMQGVGDDKAVQIMIERVDGAIITVEDCEKVSKHVSAILDVEDPISDAYNLEVSSPGIDRPLTRLKDFARYSGHEVKLESRNKIDGQAKFRGKLVCVEDANVVLDMNIVDLANPQMPKRVKIEFDNIRSAKLVLTNELMASVTSRT